MITSFAEKLKEVGLIVNVEKTELLIIRREEEEEELVLKVHGEEVRVVERFGYFGRGKYSQGNEVICWKSPTGWRNTEEWYERCTQSWQTKEWI